MKLNLRIRAHAGSNAEPGRLSTVITKEYPDSILSKSGEAVIGEKDGKMLYSIAVPPLGHGEESEACTVKERIISSGVTLCVNTSESVALVKGIAASMTGNASVQYIVAHEIAGCGAFSMITDSRDGIEEIMVNAPTENILVYHSDYGLCRTNLRFTSEDKFRFMINRMIYKTDNREFGADVPIIDAQAYDGSRVHAQSRPYSSSGGVASVRLMRKRGIGIKELLENQSATPDELAYLRMAIESGCNIIFSGSPGSGKTTMLRACVKFMPPGERIITVEEELGELTGFTDLYNMVQLKGYGKTGKGSLQDQVINALRLRPERIIVGEIRGSEARDIFFGANIGIPFMTTLHSNSAADVITRIKTRPMEVDPALVCMLDVCVFMGMSNGKRTIEEIVEYKWGQNAESEGLVNLEILPLFKNGVQSKGIGASKVFARFRDMNVLGKSEGMERFRRMSEQMRNICDIGEMSEEHYIQENFML